MSCAIKSVSDPIIPDTFLLTPFKDIYYLSFPKDRLVSKCIVYVLWATETVQTLISISDIFDIFCYDFGNLAELDDVHLTWFTAPVLSGLGELLRMFTLML